MAVYPIDWLRLTAETSLSKMNLSGLTGREDGQEVMDDGTNTAGNGLPCYWDAMATTWQPSDGSATFT
jgi:hypothetical protein